MIITIVGGGSTFTPGIVNSILSRGTGFPVDEIRMYDNDVERQAKVGVIVKYFIESNNLDVKLTLTADPKEAFTNADFIFSQIRVGKYAMREQDEKIPLRYGCVGQETCGAGGLSYGLRTIFPMIKIMDWIKEYANPNHWILNYSNPAAIMAEACRKLRPDARIINICDMPVGIMEQMAAILGCEASEIEADYYGLNHFGWFTKVRKNGEDVTEKLIEYIKENGLVQPEAIDLLNDESEQGQKLRHLAGSWMKTMKNVADITKLCPGTIPNSYLQYYLIPKKIVEQSNPEWTRANEVMSSREKNLFDAVDKYLETGVMDGKAFHLGAHGHFIVDLAVSLRYDLKQRFLIIVENNGAIKNLPDDAMVEVPAYMTANGPEVVRVGEVPQFQKGMMEQQLVSEKLLVEGAIEGSYEKVLSAFIMNKTIPSADVAKAILDDLIVANKEFWPELK